MGGHVARSYSTLSHRAWFQILDANTEEVWLLNTFGYKEGSHQTTKLTHKQAILHATASL